MARYLGKKDSKSHISYVDESKILIDHTGRKSINALFIMALEKQYSFFLFNSFIYRVFFNRYTITTLTEKDIIYGR